MVYEFDDYLLDSERCELRRGKDHIRLEPQALDLLTYLIRHRARVVTRDELIDAIWGGRIVTDAALTTRINVVRHAIGDDGKSQRMIRTLPRKGLRFVAAVREAASAYPLPLKSTGIAVALVPFVNLNRDAAGDFVAAGTTNLQTYSHASAGSMSSRRKAARPTPATTPIWPGLGVSGGLIIL